MCGFIGDGRIGAFRDAHFLFYLRVDELVGEDDRREDVYEMKCD